MRYFEESQTVGNLHDSIEDTSLEWNLHDENRPVFIITDNAPNIVKAVTMNNKWERIPCFAHTLQFAIKDAVSDAVGSDRMRMKCRSLVGFFARSSAAHAKLDEMQATFDTESTPLRLVQDVETRWNSKFAMFERLLHLRTALGAVLSSPKMPNNINNTEWM